MKNILVVLNYYYPYISGVSEYARILSEGLVQRGHSVTVLTSNHNKLPPEETINGVKVVRAPILCKISKGTISAKFFTLYSKLSKQADIVHMHLPMLEAGLFSALSCRNLVVTYHCDINLPEGMVNSYIVNTMDASSRACLSKASKVLVTSLDYAMHSRAAGAFIGKCVGVGAPIKEYSRLAAERRGMKKRIGFCGRLVEEKGIDILLKAFKILRESREDIELIIGGAYEGVAGGSVYEQLQRYICEHGISDVSFLGAIPEAQMPAFYSSLDVFTLPSVNSLEAFGMVQIEAMRCGVPVVASDLPGVRTIVQNTGAGLICERKNPESLARCIAAILSFPDKYKPDADIIEKLYGTDIFISECVNVYDEIFKATQS